MGYVQQGYSQGYVQGDSGVSAPVSSDLSALETQLQTLTSTVQSLQNTITVQNTMILSLINKVNDLDLKVLSLENSQVLPSIDDRTIMAFDVGTEVVVDGFDTVCIIRGSRFVPYAENSFMIVYDVEISGSNPSRISSIPAGICKKYYPNLNLNLP